MVWSHNKPKHVQAREQVPSVETFTRPILCLYSHHIYALLNMYVPSTSMLITTELFLKKYWQINYSLWLFLTLGYVAPISVYFFLLSFTDSKLLDLDLQICFICQKLQLGVFKFVVFLNRNLTPHCAH